MSRSGGFVLASVLVLAGCRTGDRLWRISPFDAEPGRERVNLWPLAYHSGDETSVLWPLFDVDDQGFALRPLIAKDGSDWSLVFPFASFDTDSGEGWIVPFYRVGENEGLFPLANFGRFSWVGPVWWTEHSSGLFPVASFGAFNYVGPVWWSGDDDASFGGGLFPLVWFGPTNIVGPVWWDADDAGGGLFPLFGTDLFGQGITHVGPIWWRPEAESASFGLAPLAWYGDGGRSAALLPFYQQRLEGDTSSRNVLLGLGHWRSSANEHENWLLPLYYDRAEADARDTVLVPFYWKHRRGDSAQVYTLLGNRSVAPDSHTFNLYPLWWSSADEQSSWRMLFPFFWYGREGDERTLLTPFGGRGWSESGETAFVNVLGPLYHRSVSTRRDEERTAFLWPLFERHREGAETTTNLAGLYTRSSAPAGAETSYLFGLGHAQRSDEGRAQRFWPLYSWSDGPDSPGFVYDLTLFGHARSEAGTKTRLFPLFAQESTPAQARWDALLGLAHHDRAGDERNTWVWPFYARSSGGTSGQSGLASYLTLWGSSESGAERVRQLGLSLLWSSRTSADARQREKHARALLFFTHDEEEFLAAHVPAPAADSRANRVRSETRGFLFDSFVSESATYRVWNEGLLSPDEARVLRTFHVDAAREGVPDGGAVHEILTRHGAAPASSAPEALRASLADFAAAGTHTYEYRRFRLPFLLGYERSPDELDWYGPLGLVRYQREPARSRFSFLYYGYRSESDGTRTTRDIFPFVTWDTGPAEKDISFLWRLFHYERKGERRGGHLFFIPFGDV